MGNSNKKTQIPITVQQPEYTDDELMSEIKKYLDSVVTPTSYYVPIRSDLSDACIKRYMTSGFWNLHPLHKIIDTYNRPYIISFPRLIIQFIHIPTTFTMN